MKWCCQTFEYYYGEAGSRGFAALVERDSQGRPFCLLQHRAVEPEAMGSVRSEVLTSLVSEAPIRYCPWCGRDLEKWYGKDVEALSRPGLRIPAPGPDG